MKIRRNRAANLAVTLASLLGSLEMGIAAIGETEAQCDDRYDEKTGRRVGDAAHAQNVVCAYESAKYKSVLVVFDKKDTAIQVTYTFEPFPEKKTLDARVEEILAVNGKEWKRQKEPLGSAMLVKPPPLEYRGPNGVVALLDRDREGYKVTLTVFTAERLLQMRQKGLLK